MIEVSEGLKKTYLETCGGHLMYPPLNFLVKPV